jgi:hypothetical protein
MKRPTIMLSVSVLVLPIVLLVVGCLGFIPHSVIRVAVVATGEALNPALPTLPADSLTATLVPTLLPGYSRDTPPAPTPTMVSDAIAQNALYSQVYFSLYELDGIRLARLPGTCVVGVQGCPVMPEIIDTPFDMKDVFNTTTAGMPWSRDGRYAALTTHPADELMDDRTKEELPQLERQNPADFQVNPSTLYVYEPGTNTWKEIYRAERKYIYTGVWSPDGQWLSFTMASSLWMFHAAQPEDGVYIIHPDGSGLQQLLKANHPEILGWIGNSIVLRETLSTSPEWKFRTEMIGLDGQVKPLFESSRIAGYHLSPDGGALLAADSAIMDAPTPQKQVDLLALDGSIIHPFGVFNNRTSPISGSTWSGDGSMVAFASQRRAYVAPRDALPREVYAADDASVADPSITNIQFSPDQKYLLLYVYDGRVKLVCVSLADGQVTTVQWLDKDEMQQPSAISWQP